MKTYIIKYQDKVKKELVLKTDDILKEKLPLNIISIKEKTEKKNFNLFQKKVHKKDLVYLFYELNLMLQSNIQIIDALDLLIKNEKNKELIKFLNILKSSFSNNISLKESLADLGIDHLVIAFFKISKDSGNIKQNMEALSGLLYEDYKVKTDFYKALRYPFLLLFSLIISFFSIFYFVLPKLKLIFEDNYEHLPLASKFLFSFQEFLENYSLYILITMISLFSLIFLSIKKSTKFKGYLYFLLNEKLFLFKDLYQSICFYRLFLVLDILLKSNYELHKSLKFSKVLLKDKYLLDKITLIENLLENGKDISYSFFKVGLFDDIVLKLINTAQLSNSLGFAIAEIKKIYKLRFYEKIEKLIFLIEPIFIILIVSMVLWLVFGIFIPMWDMGNMIRV